ncbi:MAG: hypothetical protein GWN62_34810 [Aliifodinibius sp.]|nr:hypothetical protein [Fodinibius sp.]
MDNIDSLPYQYFPERELGGTRIYFYFKPADTYEIRVTGKFALSNVTNDTVIDNELEPFYISYLNYALADRMCDFYSLPLGDAKKKRLYDFERILSDLSGLDTTVKKRSILGKGQTTAYGQANLGRGWTIPS